MIAELIWGIVTNVIGEIACALYPMMYKGLGPDETPAGSTAAEAPTSSGPPAANPLWDRDLDGAGSIATTNRHDGHRSNP